MPSKSAKSVQAKEAEVLEQVKEAEQPAEEPKIVAPLFSVTLRIDNNFEYHLDLPREAVDGILDPDVDDFFLEVPCPIGGSRRFLHTSKIKEIDVRGL